jgi:hypothetical protein
VPALRLAEMILSEFPSLFITIFKFLLFGELLCTRFYC